MKITDIIVEDKSAEMDPKKNSEAVPQLKAALEARRKELQDASDDEVYDIIDRIMTRIAKTHDMSGQELHDMWVDEYKEVPDTWIMNEGEKFNWADYEGTSLNDRIAIAETFFTNNGNLLESNDSIDGENFMSLSSAPVEMGKKYIMVFLSLMNNRIVQLQYPEVVTVISKTTDGYIVMLDDGRKTEFPKKYKSNKIMMSLFFFDSSVKYDKFALKMRLQFDFDLADSDEIIGIDNLVSEGNTKSVSRIDEYKEVPDTWIMNEACWKGYHKKGMKTMFGKEYPNCVKNKKKSLESYINENICPGCGGHMVAEGELTEGKDACYHKVKSRYKVWPSAYASGALVQCRKKGAANWGEANESTDQLDENLRDWFGKEKWVRVDTKGKIKGDCAREPGEGKPKCLPQAKAHSMTKKERGASAQKKRRNDPNANRSGKAINVATKVKEGVAGKGGILKKVEEMIADYAGMIQEAAEWQSSADTSKNINDYKISADLFDRKTNLLVHKTSHTRATTEEEAVNKMASMWNKEYEIENIYSLAFGKGVSPRLVNPRVYSNITRESEHEVMEDKKGYKSPSGGLTQKGRNHYNRTTGSKLKAPVTKKPSTLKKGGKAAGRRKSFCARMGGVKGPMKDKNNKPTRKALALRKWNCESVEQFGELLEGYIQQLKNKD